MSTFLAAVLLLLLLASVKDVAFRSAGLPLIRLRAEVARTPT